MTLRLDPEPPRARTGEATPGPPAASGPADIERLFRDHNSALLRFIAAKLGSEQEAREIAQEAYVQLLRLDHPETIGYLRAFLFKTAANLVIDRLRQRGRRLKITTVGDIDLAIFELSPERQVASEQAMELVRAALEELPPKCRRAFLLYRVHDLSVEEISGRMGIRQRMIRRYVSRALEHVRARLDENEGGAPTDGAR